MYRKTCNNCQLTGKPNQQIKPAPMYLNQVVEKQFVNLLLDCVVALSKSKTGTY